MSSKAKSGKDLAAFRSAHDKSVIVPAKIEAGLKKLGEGWLYEADFVRSCELALCDFSRFREQFTDFCVETGGRGAKRAWSGSKAFAQKMRESLQ